MTKQELRLQIKQQIQRLSAADRDTQSLYVCLQILGTSEWQQAHTVMLYSAMPDEVSLDLLIQDAVGAGKRVILPVIEGDTLLLRQYDPQHVAPEARFGVLEPTSECSQLKDPSEIDLAIIPGRAFTPRGVRLGRGKGYYDRLLPHMHCPLWGAAFTCQIKKEIPTDNWDKKMHKVVRP